METPIVRIVGFDPGDEPPIEIIDGTIHLTFAAMPPFWVDDPETRRTLGPFADFDQQLAAAIGLPVLWEDRELFVIESSDPAVVDRIKHFVENHPLARK